MKKNGEDEGKSNSPTMKSPPYYLYVREKWRLGAVGQFFPGPGIPNCKFRALPVLQMMLLVVHTSLVGKGSCQIF